MAEWISKDKGWKLYMESRYDCTFGTNPDSHDLRDTVQLTSDGNKS
jgi:hypothetical protein